MPISKEVLCGCYTLNIIGMQIMKKTCFACSYCLFHEVLRISSELVNFSSPLEHWNYLGVDENLGPVAVSLRREKLDEHKEHGQQYNYRVIFRTSEVC